MSLTTKTIKQNDEGYDLANQIKHFVHSKIIPEEKLLSTNNTDSKQQLSALIKKAKAKGLRGLFYPLSAGGKFALLSHYMPVAEQEGYSEFGPAIFGSYSSLDAHMLTDFGSDELQEHFLTSLVQGHGIPCFGMTEPDRCGSIPMLMQSNAALEQKHWRINGGKWFISNANKATFMTAMVRTETGVPDSKAFSMLLIPTNTPGFTIKREISILGRQQGQCEIELNDVLIPESFILGKRGQGLWLASKRLNIGRLLRSAHWLGLAQRCFDLMCERIHSERGSSAGLADKQLVRQHVFDAYQNIVSARSIAITAAISVDKKEIDSTSVNLAKYSSAQALSHTADSAVQLFGADGLSDDNPLSGIYRTARTTRILDGTDESLVSSVGRQLIQQYVIDDPHRACNSTDGNKVA